jgi:hypothetical protein
MRPNPGCPVYEYTTLASTTLADFARSGIPKSVFL